MGPNSVADANKSVPGAVPGVNGANAAAGAVPRPAGPAVRPVAGAAVRPGVGATARPVAGPAVSPARNSSVAAGGAGAGGAGGVGAAAGAARPNDNPMNAAGAPKPKKGSKAMLLGMVIFAALAAGGIGFGVWSMMDGNQKQANFEKQVADLRTQNSELLDKLELNGTCNEETIVDVDGNTVNANTADYIYVGEWGVKIKIPSGLSSVSYRFSQEAGHTSLFLWGVDCSNGQCQYFPEFANSELNTSTMGVVGRYPKGTEFDLGSAPILVFSDDNYDFYFEHSQSPYGNSTGDEIEWESSSVEMISNMLSDTNN